MNQKLECVHYPETEWVSRQKYLKLGGNSICKWTTTKQEPKLHNWIIFCHSVFTSLYVYVTSLPKQ